MPENIIEGLAMPKKFKFNNPPLTKKAFMSLLAKMAQPVPWKQSGLRSTGTSASHPYDGYSGKCKSQDKTEGGEGQHGD